MRRFALVSATLLLWGCASAPAPLPSDLRIVPPTSEAMAAGRAAFSGLWTGILDNREPHTLVVEEIEGDRAVIIAAFEEGWMRMRATFEGRVLTFTATPTRGSGAGVGTGENLRLAYRLESDGALAATLEVKGRIVRGRMTRGGTTTVSAPIAQRGATATGPPLPTDLRVIPPDRSVPKELVALSGHWSGAFEISPIVRKGNLRHALVVEEITTSDGSSSWGGWRSRRSRMGPAPGGTSSAATPRLADFSPG